MPLCTLIAGPNGSGKSTAITQIRPPGETINTDEYARQIDFSQPERVTLEAGRRVVARLSELLAQRLDFNFETTLSSHQALDVMGRANAAGYQVDLAFIALRERGLHVARVLQRVSQGGHDIPVRIIERRYDRSFRNLPCALGLADQAVLYDNTAPDLHTLAQLRDRVLLKSSLDPAVELHRRLGSAITEAYGIPTSALFSR